MEIDLEKEKNLVDRAKHDSDAFGLLYARNYDKIFGYILKRTASLRVAQDITSDVFFKALKNIGKFRWSGVPFSAWLYRIASNEIATHYRKNTRQQSYIKELYQSGSSSEELVEAGNKLRQYEDFLVLHDSIAQLPLKYQEVITLRYFEDKQIKEIGQILGKSEGTIKSLLHRGLEKLRIIMD